MSTIRHFVSDEQRDTIVGALRKGLPLRTACKIARVPVNRLKSLLAEAEDLAENPNLMIHELDIHTNEMLEFYFQVQEASGRCEETWVGYMTDAAKTDWKAAHSLLKAHNPDHWNETQKVKVDATTNAGRPQAALDLSKLSVAELEMLEKLMIRLAETGNDRQLVRTEPDKIVLLDMKEAK